MHANFEDLVKSGLCFVFCLGTQECLHQLGEFMYAVDTSTG